MTRGGQIIRLVSTDRLPNKCRLPTDKVDRTDLTNLIDLSAYRTFCGQIIRVQPTDRLPNRHRPPIDSIDKVDLTKPT
jgi:hypothetical protein